jgi:hypothetical protein
LSPHIKNSKKEDYELFLETIRKAQENNKLFNYIMRQVVIPVKFSFLAMLCARKATIFSDDLIELMHFVSNFEYENLKICRDKHSFTLEETEEDKILNKFYKNSSMKSSS